MNTILVIHDEKEWNNLDTLKKKFLIPFVCLVSLLFLSLFYQISFIQASPDSLRFSLREHGFSIPTYYPDITFSKSDATTLRQSSTQGSIGTGWIFVTAPRTWLDGKYLRFRWRADREWVGICFSVVIYDGEYVHSNDSDFPEGSEIPTKGNGLLQTVAGIWDTFDWRIDDVLIDVSGGTEEKCTVFFRMRDGWNQYSMYMDIDWFEINTGSGGSGNLYDEQFTDSVTMEKTGSYGDYGYISTGEIVLTSPTVTTQDATDVTSYFAILHGTITDIGSGDVLERGFDWDEDSGEPYANSWTQEGSYGIGSFQHPINSLDSNKTYYFRAKARNIVGWGYGNEKNFTTQEMGEMLPLTNLQQSNVLIVGSSFALMFYEGQSLGFQSGKKTVVLTMNSGNLNSSETDVYVDEGGGTFKFKANESLTMKITYDVATVRVAGDKGNELRAVKSGSSIYIDVNDNVFIQWSMPLVPLLPIRFILGMFGLCSISGGSLYAVQKIKRKEYYEGFRNGAILISIGFAFFLAWLW